MNSPPLAAQQLGTEAEAQRMRLLPPSLRLLRRTTADYLRPAKKGAALHAAAILKLLVGRLREAWPGARILFRGDSGFCHPLLMGWCERNRVDYVIGLAKNSRLHTLLASWYGEAETAFGETRLPQRQFGEFVYRAGRGRASRASSSRPNTTSCGPTSASW